MSAPTKQQPRKVSNLAWLGFILLCVVGCRLALAKRIRERRQELAAAAVQAPVTGAAVEFLPNLQMAGREVAIWAPSATGSAPLIVFSHGFGGSKLQSKTLMKALAEHGYLVVAPNHKDAGALMRGGVRSLKEFETPEKWSNTTYRDRADDVRAVLASLKADPKWSPRIDWGRVGLAGHSLGGYTVLALAGAWPSWKMPDVKAVLALSPFNTPFLLHGTLKALTIPVMYQGGTMDRGITPTVKKTSGAYEQTPSPAYYVEFNGAGHLAWTDLNPRFQESVATYSVAFFDKYLRGMTSSALQTKRSDVSVLLSK
jgi:predicted dienelactone hydrolase